CLSPQTARAARLHPGTLPRSARPEALVVRAGQPPLRPAQVLQSPRKQQGGTHGFRSRLRRHQARRRLHPPARPRAELQREHVFQLLRQRRGFGGFLRIGNRANEKYAEVTLTLYQPNGTVLFNWKRPEIETNDAFDAGGMKFE